MLAAAVPLAFLVLFFVWPVAATIHRAFFGEAIAGVASVIDAGAIGRATLTTLGLAGAGTLTTLAVGFPAALALHRRPWRGARIVDATLSAPFVLPTVVVALAFLQLERSGVTVLSAWHGIPAIVCALAFFNVAVVLRTVGPALRSIDPRLEAAAQTLGAHQGRVLIHVVWPAIRRSVGAAAAVTFLFCSTSFALVLILGGTRVRTLEAEVYLNVTSFLDLRAAAAVALVQAVLLATVAWVVGRLSRETASPSPHGLGWPRRARAFNGAWRAVALAPAVALMTVPLAALVSRSIGSWSDPTLKHFATLWSGSDTQAPLSDAITTSLWVAAAATATAMAVAALILVAQTANGSLGFLTVIATGPLAVSSVVVGTGLLLGLATRWRTWDASTLVLLVAAQALVALPLALRILGPALRRIDPKQFAAAASLGASAPLTVWRVAIPHMRSAIASATGMCFAVAIGEFGASIFLARPDSPTLPTTILRLLGRPGADSLPTASAAAVVLAAVTAGTMLLTETRARRRRS